MLQRGLKKEKEPARRRGDRLRGQVCQAEGGVGTGRGEMRCRRGRGRKWLESELAV